jgi:hypothetical protein
MAASIIHFGADECCRLLILRSVGYTVNDCTSVAKLKSFLEEDGGTDAIVLSEVHAGKARQAVATTRSYTSAPLILFEGPDRLGNESEFDLVIPPLSSPEEWLQRIADTIKQSRALLAKSKLLREQSSLLVEQSAAIRLQSVSERERSARQRLKIEEHLKNSG